MTFYYTMYEVEQINSLFGLNNRKNLFWIIALICGIITFIYGIDTYQNSLGIRMSSVRIRGDSEYGITSIEASPFATIDRLAQTAVTISPAIFFTAFWGWLAWRCGVAIRELKRHQELINGLILLRKRTKAGQG
jgi:hypothetical protein